MLRKMTKLLGLVFCVAMLLVLSSQFDVPVAAATVAGGTCGDNITWTLDDQGVLTISGSGSMYNYYYDYYNHASSAPWYQHRNTIKTVIIAEGVTSIGYYAFYNCSSLTSVTIPEGVTSIGNSGFCSCYNLTSITIPEEVTSIGDNAFSACSNLTSITIPEGVTSIGFSAFSYCSNLTAITIPKGVTSIGNYAFRECRSLTAVTIPEGVTSIGNEAFCYCSNLTSITIPEGVTSIGNDAFSYCSNLTGITIPESVTSIGNAAFYNCSSLTSVTIPEGVTSLGSKVFYYCSNLTSITIPEGVTSIGFSAFDFCYRLQDVYISDLRAWLDIKFADYSSTPMCYATNLYLNNELLTNITVPEGVTSIGCNAFLNCSSLTSVTIPEGVTSIGDFAFSGCSSLTSVTIPEGVTSIGCNAFSLCSSLTSITFPEGVTSLDDWMFHDCSSLKIIKFMGSAPTQISLNCFTGVTADVYTPCTDRSWTNAVKSKFSGNLTWKEHVYVDYVYNEDATCTKNGTQTGQCHSCGQTNTIVAPNTATGHSFGSDGICTSCGATKEIIINMTDSWGDGWSGCAIEVYGDGSLLATATISSGSSNQVTLPYDPSTTYSFQWFAGSYSSECSFEITLDGKVLATGKGSNYSNGKTIYTLEAAVSGVTLSGSITDFAEGDVTLTLTSLNGDILEIVTTAPDSYSYSLTAAPGEYILIVSKENHVTRRYAVTLESKTVTLDVKIHLIGDVDGNGKVNMGDISKINAHLKGTAPLTDEYQILCANVNGGSLNMGDTAALYSHIRGTKKFY